jgi:hypothetical protein
MSVALRTKLPGSGDRLDRAARRNAHDAPSLGASGRAIDDAVGCCGELDCVHACETRHSSCHRVHPADPVAVVDGEVATRKPIEAVRLHDGRERRDRPGSEVDPNEA